MLIFLSTIKLSLEEKKFLENLYTTQDKRVWYLTISILKNKEQAEDVFQSVFKKLIEKVSLLQSFQNQDKINGYVYVTTKNMVIITAALVSILSVTPAFSQEKQKNIRINNIPMVVTIKDYETSPQYNNIKQVGIGLTIVDKTAYVYAECCTYDSMNISVKAELQINENGSWKTIKTYSDSANGKECIITAEPTIKAATYRVKVTANAGGGKTTVIGNTKNCY